MLEKKRKKKRNMTTHDTNADVAQFPIKPHISVQAVSKCGKESLVPIILFL